MRLKLRPVQFYLGADVDLPEPTFINGYFHKFTQGNMSNDAVIIEDMKGYVQVYVLKDLREFRFTDVGECG